MKKISVRSLIIPPIVVSIGVAMFSLGLLLLGIRILKPHSTTGLVVMIIGLFYGVISVLLFLDNKGYLNTTPTASTFRIGMPMISITVDGDLNPIIPSNLYLTGEGTEHRKMGKVTLEKLANGKLYANGAEVVRYLSPNQKDGNAIQGHKLRKELRSKQLLNACIMDALLANQQLIPEEWKSGFTYFWGTIFRGADGILCVEYLCWDGNGWPYHYNLLDDSWHASGPAVLLTH